MDRDSYLSAFFWLKDSDFHSSKLSRVNARAANARQSAWKSQANLLDRCDLSALSVEAVDRDHVVVRGLSSLLSTFAKGQDSPSTACAASVVAHLLHMPEVARLEPVHSLGLHNNLNPGVLEAGRSDGMRTLSLLTGLSGEGEVIGCVDTGVDDLSCFFRNTEEDQNGGKTSPLPPLSP